MIYISLRSSTETCLYMYMYSVRQLQALNCRFKHGSADDNATGTIISRQLQKYNSCTDSTNRNCKKKIGKKISHRLEFYWRSIENHENVLQRKDEDLKRQLKLIRLNIPSNIATVRHFLNVINPACCPSNST